MNRLERLKQDLATMSPDEVLAFIRKTRVDRKLTKERVSVKKARRVTQGRAEGKAKKAAQDLSPEALARLIAELEG